jgi:CheY-like chemotaxis protein
MQQASHAKRAERPPNTFPGRFLLDVTLDQTWSMAAGHPMSGSKENVGAAASSPGRILVVDDEEALIRVIARSLRAAGSEVATASDGMRAVDLVANAPFDAIVSDIDMPRMNGIQFLQNLRQRDADVPVVLMTGNPNVESAVQAVAHGALQYLIKPLDLAELHKVALSTPFGWPFSPSYA